MNLRSTLASLSGLSLLLLLAGILDAPARAASPAAAGSRAERATAALTQSLVAAVANLSDGVPPGSSLGDILAASDAVSMLVPDCQDRYRLIDATGGPLDPANVPLDDFELLGLAELVGGATRVQRAFGPDLRTLAPLTSDMHPNCVTCHTSYAMLPPDSVVGAASLRVEL